MSKFNGEGGFSYEHQNQFEVREELRLHLRKMMLRCVNDWWDWSYPWLSECGYANASVAKVEIVLKVLKDLESQFYD